MDSPVVQLMLFFNEFSVPETKERNYSETIGGHLLPEARQLLLLASGNREQMQESLSYAGEKADPRNIIAAIETYLPAVWRIQQSLEYSASARIQLNQELEFSWTSVLHTKNKFWSNGVFVYEVVFTLVTRALAHYNLAAQLVSEQTEEVEQARAKIIQASKELRVGAGVLKFVSSTMIPRWQNPPDVIPPETSLEVVTCLSLIFLCTAQRLTVAAAILKKTSKKLIAQLLLGLEANYQNAERKFNAVPKKERGYLVPFIRDEPTQFAPLARGLAHKYLALHDVDAAESSTTPDVLYGTATAHVTGAWQTLNGISLPDSLKSVRSSMKAEVTRVGEKYSEILSDNSKVYYGKVPDLDTIDLPQQQFLAKPTEFEMPKINVLSFAAVEEHEVASGSATHATHAAPPYSAPATAPPPPYPTSSGQAPPPYPGSLTCPPGVDPEYFAALPLEMKKEVVAQQQRR